MSESFGGDLHEEEVLGKAYDTRLMKRLWAFVKPYRWQVAVTLLLVGPLFLLELAPAWIIKQGLDEALREGGTSPWLSFLGPAGSLQAFVGLAPLIKESLQASLSMKWTTRRPLSLSCQISLAAKQGIISA